MEGVIDFHATLEQIPLEAWITLRGGGQKKERKLRKRKKKRMKEIIKNKILCPTPVPSKPLYFPFHSYDPSSFGFSIHELNRAPFSLTGAQMEHEHLWRESGERERGENDMPERPVDLQQDKLLHGCEERERAVSGRGLK